MSTIIYVSMIIYGYWYIVLPAALGSYIFLDICSLNGKLKEEKEDQIRTRHIREFREKGII